LRTICNPIPPIRAASERINLSQRQETPRLIGIAFPHQVDLAVAIDIGVDVRRAVIVSTARTSIGKAYRGPSRKGPAKHAYEAALKQDLPTDVRTIIERQYQGVKANHDRVRDLRNA